MTMGSQTTAFPTADRLSTLSTLNILRNYNQFLAPSASNLVQVCHHYSCGTSIGEFPSENYYQPGSFPFSPAIGSFYPYASYPLTRSLPTLPDLTAKPSPFAPSSVYAKRSRGEKKPIPEDQKDDRYYERRKRNNEAAKKSRDARKFREDQIALRATLLEHENAVLRAQILTLREETQSLRQHMLINEKTAMPKKLMFCEAEREDEKIDFVNKS